MIYLVVGEVRDRKTPHRIELCIDEDGLFHWLFETHSRPGNSFETLQSMAKNIILYPDKKMREI